MAPRAVPGPVGDVLGQQAWPDVGVVLSEHLCAAKDDGCGAMVVRGGGRPGVHAAGPASGGAGQVCWLAVGSPALAGSRLLCWSRGWAGPARTTFGGAGGSRRSYGPAMGAHGGSARARV
ncbi:MAG: hypothetical protein ACRDRH_16035, partial [Pseudonocardia sp.]